MSSQSYGVNFSIEERLLEVTGKAEERFTKANPKSLAQYEKACVSLPGGSTRGTVYYPPFPVTIERGKDRFIWDIDGHKYHNFVGEFTVGLYGHDAALLDKILTEIKRMGTMLSGPTEYEEKLATLLCARFASCDMIRFCNSGTEANLLALGLARNATNKDTVLVFKGTYHGGVLTFSDVDAPLNIPLKTVKSTFNALEETRDLIDKNADSLGAILVEPMMGAGGCIRGEQDFLQMLRDKATEHGIILIFDEVMTSRLAPGGLQGMMEITPDLTTFGKYMGGGFSFGAFGGKQSLMSRLDARNADYLPHSGTFNNNIASMVGGYISLSERYTPEANIALNAMGDRLRDNLNKLIGQYDVPLQILGQGAVMTVHFNKNQIHNPDDTQHDLASHLLKLLHLSLLDRGFYIAHRCLITLNLMMKEDDLQGFCDAFEEFLKEYKGLLREI